MSHTAVLTPNCPPFLLSLANKAVAGVRLTTSFAQVPDAGLIEPRT